jgi:DNA-binding response OmpR family regulator
MASYAGDTCAVLRTLEGHSVSVADSEAAVLEVLTREPLDVLLLDSGIHGATGRL